MGPRTTLHKGTPQAPSLPSSQTLSQYQPILGSRIKTIVSGGAAISKKTLLFLSQCFPQAQVSEGYGTTEAGSIADETGAIYSGIDFKLKDVPSLGYFASQNKGELLVKSRQQITEYFLNEKESVEAFEEGYFCTGDIVELVGERKIKLIDRRKNFFKLSQGEFIAPQKLEANYSNSSFVNQIFVTCGSVAQFQHENVLVAIVVPNEKAVQKAIGKFKEISVLVVENSEEISNVILKDLCEVARISNFKTFEIPSLLVLEHAPFTITNKNSHLLPNYFFPPNFLLIT